MVSATAWSGTASINAACSYAEGKYCAVFLMPDLVSYHSLLVNLSTGTKKCILAPSFERKSIGKASYRLGTDLPSGNIMDNKNK